MLNTNKGMDLKALFNGVNPEKPIDNIGDTIRNLTDAAYFNKDKDTLKHIIALYVEMNNDGKLKRFAPNTQEHVVCNAAGRIFEWEMGSARKEEYIPFSKWTDLINRNIIDFVNM